MKLLQNLLLVNLKLHLLDSHEFKNEIEGVDVRRMREYNPGKLDGIVLNKENKGIDLELEHRIVNSQNIDP
jgi:hypothetical protein